MNIRSRFLFFALAGFIFSGCKKEYVGKNSIIEQIPEPAGEYCWAGGYKIISGLDENKNNVLDSNEIQNTNYVCNGNYDKETILVFSSDIGFWTDNTTGLIPDRLGIDNFDIRNYQADSVSFSCYLSTSDATAKCFVELYDKTNNKPLSNTLFSSNSKTYELKTSTVNLLNSFPKSPINLGCRFRGEKNGPMFQISEPTIKIYKK